MKRVDYWTERDDWPFVKPGYLFLPDAFDLIGREMFEAGWTGEESRLKPNGPRPSAPSQVFETYEVAGSPNLFRRIKDAGRYNQEERRVARILGLTEMQRLSGISFDQWGKAIDDWLAADLAEPGTRQRIRAVYGQMHLAAAADELTFYISDVRNGRMMPIRESDWNFDKEVVYPRFDRCSMNLDPEFIRSKPPRDTRSEQRYLSLFLHPLFVEKAQLDAIAPVIGRRYRGDPNPGPAQQSGPVTAAAPSSPPPPPPAPVTIATLPSRQVVGDGTIKEEIRALLAAAKANDDTMSQGEVIAELEKKFPGKLRGKRHLEKLEREIFAEIHGRDRAAGRRPGNSGVS